jgi:two-component system, OmpR family, KDP operon response regulator KdpE
MGNNYQRPPVVLVVEDDPDTAEIVSQILTSAGFTTYLADDGETALQQLASFTPDLVILDIALPGIDGMEVLQLVREASSVPMIMLSGYSQPQERVSALRTGADDYVTKPFVPDVLVARANALLRRINRSPKAIPLPDGQLVIDPVGHQAHVGDRTADLTPVEYRLLSTLADRAGHAVSHAFLARAIWDEPGSSTEDRTAQLRGIVSRLRQKIEADPNNPQIVQTLHRYGYWIPYV